MGEDLRDLLKELTETPGVSGNEGQIRELIREKIEDEADSIEVDALGNLIARKGSGEPTLLVSAHMDHIGLSVQRIDEDGFLRVKKIWGIYPKELVNQRVTVEASEGENLTGVMAHKPVHFQEDEEKEKLPELEDMFVDIGAEDKEDAEDMGVRVGDYIYYDRDFTDLGNDYVTAPAFDDRVGCTALVEAFNSFDEDYELVAVFSTQEEVGTKGIQPATFNVNPDVALALDVTLAGDVPSIEPHESDTELGSGVEIQLIQAWGRGLITPENVREWLIGTAEEKDHTYFRGVGGSNEARTINLSRKGVPTGSLGIPARHVHSPVEVAKLSDVEASIYFLEDAFTTLQDYF